MAQAKVALVIGAGEATGGAIARRFAREGFTACVTRRTADKLQPLVESIEKAGGRARAFGSDARKEEQVVELVRTIEREVGPIEVCVFNIGGNVRFPIRDMTTRVYTKVWEMAALAQSMARELGPEGIHVAHVVVDGAIDTPFMRDNFPERYALKDKAGILDPEAIAENYWQLHLQPRSAWTHELDLRPWMEPW